MALVIEHKQKQKRRGKTVYPEIKNIRDRKVILLIRFSAAGDSEDQPCGVAAQRSPAASVWTKEKQSFTL